MVGMLERRSRGFCGQASPKAENYHFWQLFLARFLCSVCKQPLGSQSMPEPPKVWPRTAPSYFHVLAKPTGAVCNLDCKYCFFLSKDTLYPGSPFRMAE